MSDLWTSSRLSTTRRCGRLAHYRYGLGLGEPSSDVARFGSVGHASNTAGDHDEIAAFAAKIADAALTEWRKRWGAK